MKWANKFIFLTFISILVVLFFLIKDLHKAKGGDVTYMDKFNETANKDQRDVLNYLRDINIIFEAARKTQAKIEDSPWGYKNIPEAIYIINQLIIKAKNISPPVICQKHYNLTLDILNMIKVYHDNRLKFGEGIEFEEKTRETHLKQFSFEEERQKEYFSILKKIGYNDFVIKELVNSGALTEDDINNMKQNR